MRYVDAARPRESRACTVTATNADGTVNLLVTDPAGDFAVASVPVVPVGGTPTTLGYYAQVEKTAAEVQADQAALANETTIDQQFDAAIGANVAFLGAASPNAAAQLAQLRALTRQVNGLLRIRRRKLDATT